MPARHLTFLGVLLLAAATASAAGLPATLLLSNGDYYSGEWRDGGAGDSIRWQPSFVAEPFEFAWAAISSVSIPPAAAPAAPVGALRFELFNGDALVGDLTAVTDDRFTVALRLAGDSEPRQVNLPRRLVRSIQGVGAGESKLKFSGPGDLAEWKTTDDSGWAYSRGGIATTVNGACACRDVPLPHLALIEVALSWDEKADFSLELGVTKRRLTNITDGFEIWVQGNNGQPVRVQQAQARARRRKETEEDRAKWVTDAFRLEVVGDDLIAVRETLESADLEPLQKIVAGAGQLQLRLYLDQTNNRLIVTTPSGQTLADLQVDTPYSPFESGLQLNNRAGDIRLERVSITDWNGEPPVSGAVDQPVVLLADGKTLSGAVAGFRAETNELLIATAPAEPSEASDEPAPEDLPTEEADDTTDDTTDDESTEDTPDDTDEGDTAEDDTAEDDTPPGDAPTAVRLDQVVSIAFPTLSAGGGSAPAGDGAADDGLLVTASLPGGVRVTGAPQGVADQRLTLFCGSFGEAIEIPLARLQAVRLASPAPRAAAGKRPKFPRLETDDARSAGVLTGGADAAGTSCLLWRPAGSRNAAPLLDEVSGRVLFREPPPPKTAKKEPTAPQPVQQRGVLGAIASVFSYTPPPAKTRATAPQPATMYLRAGDKLPCTIDRIDQEGVYFSSPFSEAGFAAHEHVKAIELVTKGVDGRVTSDRRDQLLTLPRTQINNPPTHLLVSTKGDYLRCRLLQVTKEAVAVEVRLEELQIDRSRVARIIWFDPPPEDDVARGPAGPDGSRDHPRVQAVRRDGVRLTFDLERLETPEQQGDRPPSPRLEGESQVLETCSVALEDIDLLLLGHRIEQAAAELSYQRWRMKHAILPREPEEGDAGDASTSFPLVGKPAPELPLPYFDGGGEPPADVLDLKQYEGQVLVLDFWASWCGPCMQVMPVLHELGEEYADRDVRVVAVNLQDPPEAISAALDRLGFKPVVALDRDGVAAQRYQVTGIPQTVVIDRGGVIANVFVGGGAKFEQRLRAAIEAALAADRDAP